MSTKLLDLNVYIQNTQHTIQNLLDRLLPDLDEPLITACRYSLLNKGKRLRPTLVYATGDAIGIPHSQLHAIAISIELIHTYSLIHDDLPAMDDDDLRRGMPTCHKVFGEDCAILAGDGLQAMAYEILTQHSWNPHPANKQIAMLQILSKASGLQGMVLGQAIDLRAEHKQLSLDDLTRMHNLKTGALFNACVEMVLQAASNVPSTIASDLLQYAYHVGLAFQIKDDILDETGNEAILGKKVGADKELAKATFCSLLGIDGAKQQLLHHLKDARSAIAPLAEKAYILRELTDFLEHRQS